MSRSCLNAPPDERPGHALEVFAVFLKLGLTSFGGPVAHLGYFRDEFVTRRAWLTEDAYASTVALCQFLPGPASSQVGFAIGLARAGYAGGLAAWLGFTLPSALLMILLAIYASGSAWLAGSGLTHGLKLVAVAVVGQAVWGMSRTFCADSVRIGIAMACLVTAVLLAGSAGQILGIVLGAVLGVLLLGRNPDLASRPSNICIGRGTAMATFGIFLALLAGLPITAHLSGQPAVAFVDAFYRSGAFVFGGGHVVLPLLDAETVRTGLVSADIFMTGYGAAQAMPGPLFTFAGYLGAASAHWPNGVAGGVIALVAIFLPGMLLLVGALPFWTSLQRTAWGQALMGGANAGVVGLLALALYDPVWTHAILGARDFAIALAGFLALTVWKVPPWIVVIAGAALGHFAGPAAMGA
jgi:chromate transporter